MTFSTSLSKSPRLLDDFTLDFEVVDLIPRRWVLGASVFATLMLAACGGSSDGGGGPSVGASTPEPGATVIAGDFTGTFRAGASSGQSGPFGGGPDMIAAPGMVFGLLDGLAEFLGISKAQIEADMQLPGATQAGVAALYGKSRAELKAFLLATNERTVTEAVSAGRMDQAQADQLKAAFASSLDQMIDAQGGLGAPVQMRPRG